jgi:hypothetical protein
MVRSAVAKKQAILETRRVVAELIAEINCLGSSMAVVEGITPATSPPKHYIGAAGRKQLSVLRKKPAEA